MLVRAMPPGPPALTKARFSELRALLDRRRRQEAGRFLVEGYHGVEEALLAGAPVEEVVIGEGAGKSPAGGRIEGLARAAGTRVASAPRRLVDRLCDAESPQGVVAVLRSPDPGAPLPFDRDGIHVVLDGIQDPGNAGAILRAADAFGCASAVFCRGTVDPLNPKVLRAAQGSHFHLAVAQGAAGPAVAAAARAAGHRVLAAVSSGGVSLYDTLRPGPRVCVVLGNETRGPAPETLGACDARLTIPLRGRAESLGVAAAAAVVLAWFAGPGGGP
jgi:TrmH family RNA methyltransferase